MRIPKTLRPQFPTRCAIGLILPFFCDSRFSVLVFVVSEFRVQGLGVLGFQVRGFLGFRGSGLKTFGI